MGRTWAEIVVLYLVILAVTKAVFLLPGVHDYPALPLAARMRRRRRQQLPTGRPIELVAEDLRRLGVRYRYPVRGTSYAKLEALLFAYDHVLEEACRCLEIEHLLGVLPPGPERDLERKRVEDSLWLVGLRFPEAA